MKKQFKFVLLAGLFILTAGIIVEQRTGAVRRAIFNRDFFSGDYNHFLPCSKLPTEAEVQRVLREHRDVIEKIRQIRIECSSPGGNKMLGSSIHVSFGNGEEYDTPPGNYNGIAFFAPEPIKNCPGKADIYIQFGGISDSVLIKSIIGGDTFFGIPYRMHNM